jgi:hypothetical protein
MRAGWRENFCGWREFLYADDGLDAGRFLKVVQDP